MRLHSLSISGFRAFSQRVDFPLDAGVVLISGPNGTGKTSFFDAILWALTGRLTRLDDPGQGPISLYSQSGQATVDLVLADDNGTILEVSRLHNGETDLLNLVIGGEQYTGTAAEVELLRRLWPPAITSDESMHALATALTRSVYLQQDLVREFLEQDSAESRFKVVAELMGAGRLNDFMLELERASRAWSRARTEPEQRVNELQNRLSALQSRLGRLGQDAAQSANVAEAWEIWWASTLNFGLLMEPPSLGSMNRESLLEQALGFLRGERQSSERKLREAETLLADIDAVPPRSPEDQAMLQRLDSEISDLQSQLAPLQIELARRQAEAAAERAEMTQRKSEIEELRTLASVALRHIDGTCPVCGQVHDIEHTRGRLESLVSHSEVEPSFEASKAAAETARQIAQLEKSVADKSNERVQVQARMRSSELAATAAETRLRDLGIEEGLEAARERLEQLIEVEGSRSAALDKQYRQGEGLALALARANEVAQRSELENDVNNLVSELETAQATLANHDATGNLAKLVLSELRDASQELVSGEVRRVEPAVARIYSRMDPHPAFKSVELLTSFARGHGRVSAVVGDKERDVLERDPVPLFSSSQLNALAVSVFLGLNLGIPSPPLKTILLDDPLQSLDDVNLLGLIDTLRRTKSLRQLIISTHDRRFSDLLQVKLRPVGDGESTFTIEMADWSREGPTVNQSPLPKAVDTSQVA